MAEWTTSWLSYRFPKPNLPWVASSLSYLFTGPTLRCGTSSLSYCNCTSSLSCLLLGMFLLWATSLSQLFLLKARLLLLLLARPLQCVYEPPAEVPRSARVTPNPKTIILAAVAVHLATSSCSPFANAFRQSLHNPAFSMDAATLDLKSPALKCGAEQKSSSH